MKIGDTFETNNYGQLAVIRYGGYRDVDVKFTNTGFIKRSIRAEHIRAGKVKDMLYPVVAGVGYLGDGEYTPKHKEAYSRWKNMIQRCYLDSCRNDNPTYKDCTVAEEWHNFQNFANWFYTQDFKSGYELDKDIKVPGNKIYSPETCLLVTRADNTAEMNKRTKTK